MATAAPGYMTGSRRTYNPIVGGGGGNFAGGTAALNDSEVLARLIANLRNFYSAQPGMGNQQPSIVDVLNQSAGADLGQQGPGGEMSAPAPGVDTLDPQTLSLLGSIFGAGGMLAQNSGAAALGNIMSTGGALAQQNPLDALQTLGSVGAGMAGANPGVIGAVNTGINILQDPVPMTSGDIAGKALNVALGFTPIGTVNSLMSALTGKSLGDVVKGAMTPVENAMPNMVPGVNPSAAVQMGTPAQPDTPPSIALTDLALSMLDMPAPMAEATPSNPEAPMGIPGESGFGTPSSVDTSIADAIAEAMSAMAESSMNAPSDGGMAADATGDAGSVGDGAPSSPSDGDGVAY